MSEGLARDELHDDVWHSVDVARIEHADEIRMVQLGHRAGGALEQVLEIRILAEVRRDHLDRDFAVKRTLSGQVHGTEVIGSEKVRELEARKAGVQGIHSGSSKG